MAATLEKLSATAMVVAEVGAARVATRAGEAASAAAAAACESATDAAKRREPGAASHSPGVPATVAVFAASAAVSVSAAGRATPGAGAQLARDIATTLDGELPVAVASASRSAGPKYVLPSSDGPHHGSCICNTTT